MIVPVFTWDGPCFVPDTWHAACTYVATVVIRTPNYIVINVVGIHDIFPYDCNCLFAGKYYVAKHPLDTLLWVDHTLSQLKICELWLLLYRFYSTDDRSPLFHSIWVWWQLRNMVKRQTCAPWYCSSSANVINLDNRLITHAGKLSWVVPIDCYAKV